MSLAKLNITQKSRKEWTCGKCREVIPKGEKVIHFAVGFRGFEQHRCSKTFCYPTRGERESSMLASVYDAQDSFDPASAGTDFETLQQMVTDVAEEARAVASEYESNEMFEINEDLQERAEILNSAADELDNWDSSLDSEPEEDDDLEDFESAHDEWMDAAIDAAQTAVNDMELP